MGKLLTTSSQNRCEGSFWANTKIMADREEHGQLEVVDDLLLDFSAPLFSKDSTTSASLKLHHASVQWGWNISLQFTIIIYILKAELVKITHLYLTSSLQPCIQNQYLFNVTWLCKWKATKQNIQADEFTVRSLLNFKGVLDFLGPLAKRVFNEEPILW